MNIIITGASRGIGKAIAKRFAENGWNIVINCDHSVEELNRTKFELEQSGASVLAEAGDVGDFDFAKKITDECIAKFGRVDALVNNAGISYIGLLTEMRPDEWEKIVRTDLTCVFNMCHEVARNMLHYHNGRILNISSVWGNVGASMEAAYSACKGGVNSLTKALGKELAPSGISVNAIACGAIDTKMNACFNKEEIDALVDEIPYCRMGKAEEVAELAYSVITGPSYLTSQVITLDGGWI